MLFALDSDHRWMPDGGYSDPQRAAIAAYLDFMVEHAPELELPRVDGALRRWSV